jgi:hypothetical protein
VRSREAATEKEAEWFILDLGHNWVKRRVMGFINGHNRLASSPTAAGVKTP